jgi:hypothetical protein
LSVDPASNWNPHEPQSWNRYSYAGNNPMVFIDPDGRWKKKPFAWIVEYLRKRHVKIQPLFSNMEAARALRQNRNVDSHGVRTPSPRIGRTAGAVDQKKILPIRTP